MGGARPGRGDRRRGRAFAVRPVSPLALACRRADLPRSRPCRAAVERRRCRRTRRSRDLGHPVARLDGVAGCAGDPLPLAVGRAGSERHHARARSGRTVEPRRFRGEVEHGIQTSRCESVVFRRLRFRRRAGPSSRRVPRGRKRRGEGARRTRRGRRWRIPQQRRAGRRADVPSRPVRTGRGRDGCKR